MEIEEEYSSKWGMEMGIILDGEAKSDKVSSDQFPPH
jgi:hypothetical protein